MSPLIAYRWEQDQAFVGIQWVYSSGHIKKTYKAI